MAVPMAVDVDSLAVPSHRGPALKVRRYGRGDFEEFNNEDAKGSHLCVGRGTIGSRVEVDCKYNWVRAQWGALGSKRHPAGVVYMNITFKQPHGYWLESASVFITLSEDAASYALDAPRRSGESSRKKRKPLTSDYAVQIREYYGPYCITGAKSTAQRTVNHSALPTVGAMGMVEVGGMGRTSAVSKEVSDRWVFRGIRGTPKGGDGIRTLEWELKENLMDPGQVHNQEFHTAFAFEHSLRPVFMRVEIEGKLRSSSQQLRHRLASFSTSLGRKDNSTLTRIDLGGNVEFRKSLDEAARGLNLAMGHENHHNPPLEVSGPATARFTYDVPPVLSGCPDSNYGAEQLERPGSNGSGDPLIQGLLGQLDDQPVLLATDSAGAEAEPQPQAVADESRTSSAAQMVATTDGVDEATLDLLKVPIILYLLRFLAMLAWSWSWSSKRILNSGEQLKIGALQNRTTIPRLVRQVSASGVPYHQESEAAISHLASAP